MNADKRPPKGLSQEKWLQLAMKAMENHCKCKFSLSSLINAMPVSKGSFYWHFKDREEFQRCLVKWGRFNLTINQNAFYESRACAF